MIRHSTQKIKIQLHCRSAATSSAPNVKVCLIPLIKSTITHTLQSRASETISNVVVSKQHKPSLPEGSVSSRSLPTRKVWSRPPQQPIPFSPTSAEIPATRSHREINTAPPLEALKKWSRPAVPPPRIQSPALSQPLRASPTAHIRHQEVSQPIISASRRTSLSPDSNFERLRKPKTPPRQELNISLDTDPADKPLRPKRTDTHRRSNQKAYLEGKGRFECVSSKVFLQQSANAPLSKKKTTAVPKLIKARRMDVFIPSTLSVAALAKLLDVKLGT